MTVIALTEWETKTVPTQLTAEEQELAAQFTEGRELEILQLAEGLRIRTSAFVGRVQIGKLTINVSPKIPGPRLIRLLRYAYDLSDLRRTDSVQHEVADGGFRDLLAWQLSSEARRLTARGLRREYRAVEAMLSSPRGRLRVDKLARTLPGSTTLPCRYQPRLLDCDVNRLLLAGLNLARRGTGDSNCRLQLGRLVDGLQEQVAPIVLNRQAIRQGNRRLNRLTAVYQPALQIIELLMSGEGVVLDPSRSSVSASGFLFDMNRFFQALLSRFLGENLRGQEELLDERRLRGMMTYEPTANPRTRRAPTPRPDFTVNRDGRVVAMLDAKYRDVWEKELPRSMLYQLAMYALSDGAHGQATILYPTEAEGACDQVIRINDPVRSGALARVVVRPVLLRRLEEAVDARDTTLARRNKRAFARELVFGGAL